MLKFVGAIVRIATACTPRWCECFEAEGLGDHCLQGKEGKIVQAVDTVADVGVVLDDEPGIWPFSIAQLSRVG